MPREKDIYKFDPFASIIVAWRDETKTKQPTLPKPEYNLVKQPVSNNIVKQNRENKTI